MTTKTAETNHAISNAKAWLKSIEEMLAVYESIGPDEDDTGTKSDEARQAIEESILSLLVRDGWRQPGATSEGAEEYELLLSTGGPACRIWGKLDPFNEPETAELQWQDWGTPWTQAAGIAPAPIEDTLLRFARCFYFGG